VLEAVDVLNVVESAAGVGTRTLGVLVEAGVDEVDAVVVVPVAPPEIPTPPGADELPEFAAAWPAVTAKNRTETAVRRIQPDTVLRYDKPSPSLSLRLRG
jgi:hypothetical protein